MNADDVREMLRKRIDATNQKAVADELGVSAQYLCDVMYSRKAPGEAITSALGLVRVVSYVPVDKDTRHG